MTDLEARPYRYFHPLTLGFIPRAKHADTLAFLVRDGWLGRAEGRYSWSLFSREKLLGFGGITPAGRAWVFVDAGGLSVRQVRCAAALVLRVLGQHLQERGPVFADVDANDLVAVRFSQFLGFKRTAQLGPFPYLEVWRFDGTDCSV